MTRVVYFAESVISVDAVDAGVMVKRVRHYSALGWVLTSDNASYTPIQPD